MAGTSGLGCYMLPKCLPREGREGGRGETGKETGEGGREKGV